LWQAFSHAKDHPHPFPQRTQREASRPRLFVHDDKTGMAAIWGEVPRAVVDQERHQKR